MSNHIQICTVVPEGQKMSRDWVCFPFFCCVVLMSLREVGYSMSENASLLHVIVFSGCLVVHFIRMKNLRIIHW